jgi:hypothetical protein
MAIEGRIGRLSILASIEGLYPSPGVSLATDVSEDAPNLAVVGSIDCVNRTSRVHVGCPGYHFILYSGVVGSRVIHRGNHSLVFPGNVCQRYLLLAQITPQIGVDGVHSSYHILLFERRKFFGLLVSKLMVL